MALASLILGITSIIIGIFGASSQWIGAICGIIGIILGKKAKKLSAHIEIATAGYICSIIGTVFSLIFFVACMACVGVGLSLWGLNS